MRKIIAGVPWYTRENYTRIREIMADAVETLPESFDAWQVGVETMVEERVAANPGLEIRKIFIDPVEFSQWCKQKGHKTDIKARAEFALVGSEAITKKSRH